MNQASAEPIDLPVSAPPTGAIADVVIPDTIQIDTEAASTATVNSSVATESGVPHADIVSGLSNRSASILTTFFRLQSGGWWTWLRIFLLQNGRYCPVYLLPLLTAHLIDRIDHTHPWSVVHMLPWALAATGGLCALTVFCNTYGRSLRSRVCRTMTANLRSALMHRLNTLEFSFHDKAEHADLQNKFTLDMQRMEGYECFISETLFMHAVVITAMFGIVAWSNPWLCLILLAAVPLNVAMARLFWGRINDLNEQYRRAETGFIATLAETLNGLRTIRAHAVERFAETRITRAAGNVAEKAIRLDLMSNLFGSGSWAIETFLNMALVGCGVLMVSASGQHTELFGHAFTFPAFTLGQFTLLLSYYATISGSLGAIVGSLPNAAAAGDAIRSLSELYHERTEPRRGPVAVKQLKGDIRFTKVEFDYPGSDRHCLKSLDLEMRPGASLALVGPSGGGKSTVASLILGFYKPTRGKITIDGADICDLDRRSLRKFVGVVSQEVVLFRDSILVNVTWGDPNPDLDKARKALERAQAMDFVNELPGGIEHVLGDQGGGLSGGQRQRLAIARALYRDPRLLILDEATSALDNDSERRMQLALEELKRDRTTLIIAHRLSTIRSADRIVVLVGGAAVESGTYDELIAKGGAFAQLAGTATQEPAEVAKTI